jgi:hypothetical protein
MGENKGIINNKERSLQVKKYDGLTYGAVTPSDIDGFVEFKGKLIIFWELKLRDTKLPNGQKWGLERMCDTMEKGGIPTYLLVVRHEVEDTSQDIDVATCRVSDVRHKGQWKVPGLEMNLKQVIDLLRAKHL